MTTIDPPRAIRVKTSTGWADLVIAGPKGDTGAQGPQGPAGASGSSGAQGPPGQGVPAGGTIGMPLVKASAVDYATQWNSRLVFPPTGAGGDIIFGGDTNLYRSAANTLKTDGALAVVGGANVGGLTSAPGASGQIALSSDGSIYFGSDYGLRIYRSGSYLATNGPFYAVGDLAARLGDARQVIIGDNNAGAAGIRFGSAGDANLWRYAANILQTDGRLIVRGDGSFCLHMEVPASGGAVYPMYYRVAGDTQARWLMDNGGGMSWGPGGTTALDTSLYRQQAGVLRTQQLWMDSNGVIGLANANGTLYFANAWNCYLQGRASDGMIQSSGVIYSPTQLQAGTLLIAYGDAYARVNAATQVFTGDISTVVGGQPTGTRPAVVFGNNADAFLARDAAGRITTGGSNVTDFRAQSNQLPRFSWNALSNGADQKKFQAYIDSNGSLNVAALNDAESAQTIELQLTRTTAPYGDGFLPDRLLYYSYYSSDLNNEQRNGWCYANGIANQPPSSCSQWLVQTIMWGSNGYGKQIAYGLYTNEVWTRYLYASSWNAWNAVGTGGASGGGDSAWTSISLASGWAWGNSAYTPPRYRKLSSGMVYVQGMLVWTGGGAQPSGAQTIFTLPAGYRPGYIVNTQNVCSGNAYGTSCRIDVGTNGVVSYIQGDNVSNFMAMTFQFFAEA